MVNLYIMLFTLKSNESEMKLSLKVYRLKTHYFAILLTTISKLFFGGGFKLASLKMAGYNILDNHHDHFTLSSHCIAHVFVISGVYVISECARPLTGPRLERTVTHGCIEVPPRFGVRVG